MIRASRDEYKTAETFTTLRYQRNSTYQMTIHNSVDTNERTKDRLQSETKFRRLNYS